jgi:hypothetical protein
VEAGAPSGRLLKTLVHEFIHVLEEVEKKGRSSLLKEPEIVDVLSFVRKYSSPRYSAAATSGSITPGDRELYNASFWVNNIKNQRNADYVWSYPLLVKADGFALFWPADRFPIGDYLADWLLGFDPEAYYYEEKHEWPQPRYRPR